ncbi:MAG TPA: hypothetical protein VD788_10515 [Candidatus Polarisedimenticolaceae bacterium]|nr:hypothetical protein [Candidatus Polarisedimenticolaceae bacterium]
MVRRSHAIAGLIVVLSVALPAEGNSSPVASATGGYRWTIAEDDIFGIEVTNRHLNVSARKHTDGSSSGIFVYDQVVEGESFRFVVSVTCFEVYDGNRAKVGGVVEMSNFPPLPAGVFAWFQAIDNGEGVDALPDRSTLLGFGDEAANEAFCNSPDPPRFGPWDVIGNLQVQP